MFCIVSFIVLTPLTMLNMIFINFKQLQYEINIAQYHLLKITNTLDYQVKLHYLILSNTLVLADVSMWHTTHCSTFTLFL
jgi:hypothetical protein